MITNNKIPNWNIVTDNFSEPKTCSTLLQLLTIPNNNAPSQAWKKKQFYQEENLILFAEYAKEKLFQLPNTDKDYFHLILRIMYLYRMANNNLSAYEFALQNDIHTFIETTLHFKKWDNITKYISLSFLLSKYKNTEFTKEDDEIFHRVLFDTNWITHYHDCFNHEELLALYLWYIRKYGRIMEDSFAEDYLIGIATYINTYSVDLATSNVTTEYAKWVSMFSQSSLNKNSLRIHKALLSHFIYLTGTHTHLQLDEYCYEIRHILLYSDEEFINRYIDFIGKMISYVPFYTKYESVLQRKNFKQLISLIENGTPLQVSMLQRYLIPLLIQDFDYFAMYLVKEKELAFLSYILFTIFTEEDRFLLSDKFEMEPIYYGLEKRTHKSY